MIDLFRRAARKPLDVLAYRSVQGAKAAWMRRSGGWRRVEHAIVGWWTADRITQLVSGPRCLIANGALGALNAAAAKGLIDRDALVKVGTLTAEGRFSLLGANMPVNGPLPWHSDWRYDQVWAPRYFKAYDFYQADRRVPFDVKYPWELSRLSFLISMVQAHLLSDDPRLSCRSLAILDDWRANNPLAFSVNWYPMEASMRGVSLVLLFEMLVAAGTDTAQLRSVIHLLTMHGEFVSRNLEFNDVRGNHYAANAACLFLIGLTLRSVYPDAADWSARATRIVAREIELQILCDGVDFEKSVSYHRLVTELFLLSLIAAKRSGVEMPAVAQDRILAAVRFTNAYTRRDGWTPNLGDNDDAYVLQFDGLAPRDHRPLAALGAAFFADSKAKPERFFSSSIPLLLGEDGVETFQKLPEGEKEKSAYFASGGIAIARSHDHYLFVDVGEVGLKGRGGHGHNDLLSFELVIDNTEVVVDAGSYLYTGDLKARRWFQSTAAHNGLQVDGVEIAPILGTWSIADSARPLNVGVVSNGPVTVIRACHDGYRSLPDPVLHTREFQFDLRVGRLQCSDWIDAAEKHRVERFFHLPPGADVTVLRQEAQVNIDGRQFRFQWTTPSVIRVDEGWHSPSYGVRFRAPVIILTDECDGEWTSTVMISSGQVSHSIGKDSTGLVPVTG